eukprot:TRINITY_DN136802_c0_g1_i1.p1 TRINITY_DN136802_c0_g1~~TRINITY_DN136802_c0_g1_i1.p1  ORF type:complete len:726 (+),score=50.23 TRINITY_DN136802_c0_g1_i1:176-2353(+)
MEHDIALNTFTLTFKNPEYETAFHSREKKVINTFASYTVAMLLIINITIATALLFMEFRDSVKSDLVFARVSHLMVAMSGALAEWLTLCINCMKRLKGFFAYIALYSSIFVNTQGTGIGKVEAVVLAVSVTQVIDVVVIAYAKSWLAIASAGGISMAVILPQLLLEGSDSKGLILLYWILYTYSIVLSVWNCYNQEYTMRKLFCSRLIQQMEKEQYQGIFDKLPDGVLISEVGTNKLVCVNRTVKEWTIGPCEDEGKLEDINEHLADVAEVEGKHKSLLDAVCSDEIPTNPLRIKIMKKANRIYEASCHEIALDCKKCKLTIIRDQTEFEEVTKARMSKKYQKVLIASVTHEIRTPLNIEIGILDTLSDLDLGPTCNHYLSIAKKNIKLLAYFVNDIQDLYDSGTESVVLNRTRFSINDILTECEDLMAYQVSQKRLEFYTIISEDVPKEIISDKARYMRILLNLLTNAVKYTFQGKIIVEVRVISINLIETSVKDTGIGIRQEIQDRIFEFASTLAETDKCANPQGIGIGLSMCKKLATALGGGIEVFSQVGIGTTFTFTIQNLEESEYSPRLDTDTRMFPMHCINEIEVIPKSCTCSRYLIVDDNFMNILVLQNYLGSFGVSSDHALNGEEAVKMVRERAKQECCGEYAAIFMDINMPVMNGISATQVIREYSKTVIIAVTAAEETAEFNKKLYEVGMNCMIQKPVTKDRFIEVMHRYGLITK